ncbi:transposase [Streptomyces sp. NPDC002809]|uniref:transposase n=1 Tax=Streptomyces sp. NPDC002809 TaxID=3154433 RepID=UPI003318C8AF
MPASERWRALEADGGKSRDGRKRHILTDAEGLLLEVTVTTADVHDSKAAPALLETFMDQPGRLLKLVWVDSAYRGPALAQAFARHGVRIEVVRRSDGQRGFAVLARRWVVERTLSRLSRSRRLNRDHERRPDHHTQMVWWAAVIRLSRRLAGDAPRWSEKRPDRLPKARAGTACPSPAPASPASPTHRHGDGSSPPRS